MKKIIVVVVLVVGLAGYFTVSAALDAGRTVMSGADIGAFVASHWPAWLFFALAAFTVWGAIGLSSAASLLRGGRGGSGPYTVPLALKVFGVANLVLLVASVLVRLI